MPSAASSGCTAKASTAASGASPTSVQPSSPESTFTACSAPHDIDCKLASLIADADRAERVKGITPKSVFQIGGSGSVGTASLRGMPMLLTLRKAGFRIWPFDSPAAGQPLVVEMYTRLNTGPVHKSNPAARAAYLAASSPQTPPTKPSGAPSTAGKPSPQPLQAKTPLTPLSAAWS